MKPQNSGSIAASTGSTASKLRRKCVSSPRPTTSGRMPGDFPWLMFNGQALPQEHQQSLWLPSSRWQSSSAAGSGQRGSAAQSTAIPSFCRPSPQPLSRGPHLPVPEARSDLSLQTSLLLKRQSGSAPPPAFQGPTCHLQGSCLPSSRSLSFPPLPKTLEWGSRDIQVPQFPRSTSEAGKQSSTPGVLQSATAPLPASSSCRTSQNQLCNASGPDVPKHQCRSPLLPPGPLPVHVFQMHNQVWIQKEGQKKLFCGRLERPPPRREQQESIQTNKTGDKKDTRVVPAHSILSYNNAVVNHVPGSVPGMRVSF